MSVPPTTRQRLYTRADELPEGVPERPGPLAGWLTGLRGCATPWLLTVPCDSPTFPLDLAVRLAAALQAEDAELAMAATPDPAAADAADAAGAEQRDVLHCAFSYSGWAPGTHWSTSTSAPVMTPDSGPSM